MPSVRSTSRCSVTVDGLEKTEHLYGAGQCVRSKECELSKCMNLSVGGCNSRLLSTFSMLSDWRMLQESAV